MWSSDYRGKKHTYLILWSQERETEVQHIMLTTFHDGRTRITSTTESKEDRDWDSMRYDPQHPARDVFLKPFEKRRTWIRLP